MYSKNKILVTTEDQEELKRLTEFITMTLALSTCKCH